MATRSPEVPSVVRLPAARIPGGPDPLLAPFLDAAEADAARERLGELLQAHAAPLVRAVVRGQLSGPVRLSRGEDQEDVLAAVLLRLAEHLWSSRAEPSTPPIADFMAYVATVAHNACHAFLRRRYPERTRLRNRVRYVLGHHPALGLWQAGGREWVGGLAAWRGQAAPPEAAEALRGLKGRLAAVPAGGRAPLPFPDLVLSLVRQVGRPCGLDDLVGVLADVLGVSDAPVRDERADAVPEDRVADGEPSPAETVERRDQLGHLWAEIRLLPARQRAALLLNLRDPAGADVIALFPATGVASQAEVAAALEMDPAALSEVWPELPKDDDWIAERLGVSRRQVINFRKCARERLARRLNKKGAFA
jgi:DNA-directed RNA polymerase specialized sigma24 family protein